MKQTFKSFISENDLLDNTFTDAQIAVSKLIKKDCSYFLSTFVKGDSNNRLYRGIHDMDNENIHSILYNCLYLGAVRENRRPRDSSQVIHQMLDDYFEKQTGIKYRSASVFATKSFFTAEEYGEPYLIFPIGKFDYAWSPDVYDAYLVLGQYGNMSGRLIRKIEKIYPEVQKLFPEELEYVSLDEFTRSPHHYPEAAVTALTLIPNMWHFNKGIEMATSHEIMISCKEYYLIDSTEGKKILPLLGIK